MFVALHRHALPAPECIPNFRVPRQSE